MQARSPGEGLGYRPASNDTDKRRELISATGSEASDAISFTGALLRRP